MPDLALCQATNNCSKRLECFRYMCKRELRNVFCDFERICGEWNQWKYIYSIDGREVREVEEVEETTNTKLEE